MSGENEARLGWALYLGPSILDHSCSPTAEVEWRGNRLVVRSRLNLTEIPDLRTVFISYIDITAR